MLHFRLKAALMGSAPQVSLKGEPGQGPVQDRRIVPSVLHAFTMQRNVDWPLFDNA